MLDAVYLERGPKYCFKLLANIYKSTYSLKISFHWKYINGNYTDYLLYNVFHIPIFINDFTKLF